MSIFKRTPKLEPTWAEPKPITPTWFDVAKKEIGTKEVSGSGDNPRVIEYHSTTTLKATEDSISWCSSFVNWCFKQAGIKGTNNAAARSWLNWGTELKEPKQGCVVIYWRVAPDSWQGHVGFVDRVEAGKVYTLGGNQSDAVNIKAFPVSQVLGYRWPKGDSKPSDLDSIIRAEINSSGLILAKPQDAKEFFKNGLNENSWLSLVRAMIEHESGFDPKLEYKENFKNSKGEFVISTGLLQLSYESAAGYGFKVTTEQLKDPATNIKIGVAILAKWILKDGVIAGGASKGASRYWSVLREPKIAKVKNSIK